MKYPEYAKVNGNLYKINTNFKVAIECNEVARDNTIGNFERALAIIYLLFENGLDNPEDYEGLLEKAKTFLSCGKEIEDNEEPDMDYVEDYDYIWTSMYSDYNGLDIDKEDIHWWKFNKLMNGLSNSEMGNCCVLNRIRNLRNYDTRDIKDSKQRQKIEKAKQQVALKRNKRENNLTQEQEEGIPVLLSILLGRRERLIEAI